MFALLGEIVFETLDSPTGYESRRAARYAQQRVLQARPRLQWIADDLEAINLEIRLHSSFTNPDLEILALEAAAADHLARPLVFGNGNFRGLFVLVSLEFAARQMSAIGDLISVSACLGLMEFDSISGLGAASLFGAIPALGAIGAAPGAPTAPMPYTAPGGVSSALAAPASPYTPASLLAPGISPLLSLPVAGGAAGPRLMAADVPTNQIVRGVV